MRVMKEVCFDTNVYRHICLRENGITNADVSKLFRAIRADEIRILTSTQVIEETISAVLTVPEEAVARLKLIRRLAKRKRIVQFHTDFANVVRAYANGDKIHAPFIAPPFRL